MYTDIHTDFILTPIQTILEQGINASQSLPSGIESYPISEYHLQSLFLRMTGASEQKMKCIFWQMATDDFEYRYKYQNYQGLGECSTYTSKNTAFRDLVTQITKKDPAFTVQCIWSDFVYDAATISAERTGWEAKVNANRQKHIDYIIQTNKDAGHPLTPTNIAKMTVSIMGRAFDETDFNNHLSANKRRSVTSQLLSNLCTLIADSNVATWRNIDYKNFCKYSQAKLRGCEIAERTKDGINLLSGSLVGLYDTLVYQHRNRIAHNTVVYQQNLPALETLASKDYYLQNYFFRFAIIILMDEVFLRLYKVYLQAYKQRN